MITVHHLDNSRSQRVLWLLEELALDYRVVPYAREPNRRAPASLQAVHPLGKAPVVETDGLVLAESGAIIEYLLDRHDAAQALRPAPGSPARLAYVRWLHYAEASIMPQLLLRVVFDGIETGPLPFLIRPFARALARGIKRVVVDPQLVLHLDHMEEALLGGDWFAGAAFSAADIQMSFPVQAAASLGLLADRPALSAWQARIEARPAWQRGVERGGAFAL